jgi:hypothetical protein
MAKEKLSKAVFVERGYGQVEPNHLSAQRTGQIYAQLPAAADIDMLENGQFVKYDYANEEVNFTGAGEWMLVFNEVKVYRDFLGDQDFAMIKDNYMARVYSPADAAAMGEDAQSRYYGGKDAEGNDIEKVTAPADIYELDSTEDPFHFTKKHSPKMMKPGTTMVPRVFKTNIGDIYTTNCVNVAEPALGDMLAPAADGYLAVAGDDAAMKWQVVKVYTLADRQKAVKIMRVA